MPVLRLGKERLDPDLAFAHGFGELVGGVIAADPLQVRLVEAALDLPPLGAVGALGLERTGVADGGRRLVDPCSLGVFVLVEAQLLAAGAAVEVAIWLVGEPIST